MATGRGAKPIAGISSYCVGNLRIPGYPLPWEDSSWEYASNLASPLDIEVNISTGMDGAIVVFIEAVSFEEAGWCLKAIDAFFSGVSLLPCRARVDAV